jgi:D-tyrosyl-tRNA(Tyr) deacylase
MKAVVQRVKKADVKVAGEIVGEIEKGLLVLLGIDRDDVMEDADYILNKIINLRIFSDENDKMNKSVGDVNGGILLVSQFTLLGDTKKGNRPSFGNAMPPDQARSFYEAIEKKLKAAFVKTATGEFGADMAVSLVNDGPVTLILDSKK